MHLDNLKNLDPARIPKHIAIIPDGNRRWAKRNAFSSSEGHTYGARIIMDIVQAAKNMGVKAMTFYTFSTENWQRPRWEVAALLFLLKSYLKEQEASMIANGIRLQTIGDLSSFSPSIQKQIHKTKAATARGSDFELILALNYGGRDEICRAVRNVITDYANGKLKEEDVTEVMIAGYLDTARWGDPELMIRTSGEFRISNFLLWQLSYTEIYVADVLWPDFTPHHLHDAILNYQLRERRLGVS